MAESGGGNAPAEIRIRLVIDDGTAETLKKIKDQVEDVGDEAKKTHSSLKELLHLEELRTGFEVAHGIFENVVETLRAGYEIAEKFGDAAIEASTEAQVQQRAMSGTLFMLDQGQHSMAAISDYAGELREDLEKAGHEAGVPLQQMTDMFNTVVERGHLSSEQAKELTEQMAMVGKVSTGGMQGLAQGFAMMELGVIRARNPLVQLIATTGLLKGNAHAVAQQLQKMTPEKQMELAEKALAKQAENLKKQGGIQLTLPELKTAFSGYREMFFESMGKPMLDKLLPILNDVSHWLADNSEKLKEYADYIGEGFSDFIGGVKEALLGVYAGIKENWETVSATFHQLFDEWKEAWDYSVDDTTTMQAMFKQITKDLLDTFREIMPYIKAFGEVMMDAKDAWNKFNDESKGPMGDSNITVGDTQVGVQQKAVAALQDSGTREEFEQAATRLERMAKDTYDGIFGNKEKFAQIEDFLAQARAAREAEDASLEGLKDNISTNSLDQIGEKIRAAQDINDKNYIVAAGQMLLGSVNMAKALQEGAIQVNGGFEGFMKVLEEKAPKVATALKHLLQGSKDKIENIKGMGGVNFNIGNITIHQDFRDQNPDQVAVVFRQDLMKHALARTQARTATPFGL